MKENNLQDQDWRPKMYKKLEAKQEKGLRITENENVNGL
jgi:hypothetical protein